MKVNKQLVKFSLSAIFLTIFYLRLHWVFVAAGASPVTASMGYSPRQCSGFSFQWLLLWWSMGSRYRSSSGCSTWAQKLWVTGLVAPQLLGSSWTRDRTHVPCTGRWILNHYTPREVPATLFYFALPCNCY